MQKTLAAVGEPLPILGVGAMPFSQEGKDTSQSIPVWHRAFDLGMRLINTADIYAPSWREVGHNERLVGAAVAAYGRDEVFVVTKVGITCENDVWARDNRPEYLVKAAEASNERIGFTPDAILLHRLNRSQSFADAVGGLLEIKARGLARHIGLSNVHRDELERAWELSGGQIAFVENERSPRYREDADVLALCNELGIAYLAWSPLGGGDEAARLGEFFPEFAEVGEKHDASAQEVALAWLIAQGPSLIPIPAFTRIATAESAATAAFLQLDAEDLARLDASATGPGSVYPD